METQAEFNPALRDLAIACPEALTDQELMVLICHSTGTGQIEGLFSEIFRRYNSKVNSWCFRLTRDRSSALDLTQEVFFKAYRHIGSFRGDSKLSTWLYAITRNHCLTFLKKNAIDPVESGEPVSPGLRDFKVTDPDRAIAHDQLRQRMWQMFDSTLEPLERRVMTLHYGYEIPLATITHHLALSNPSGAKAYIVNARRKLSGAIRRRGLNSDLIPMDPALKTQKTAA
jgi:RNA polymerase sigma-70 factor, ECF subfamily